MPRGFCFFSLDGVGLDPSLQVQSRSVAFGQGPPLQGDFVRRVVPRPAPTRGRGTSMYRSDEIPLQRRPSPRWVAWFRWATATAQAPTRRECPGATKPRTFTWRKTRQCGDRAQAGHGWPALACWSHGWRNQAMRTIPTPPRLPPKPVHSGTFQAGQVRHHSIGRRTLPLAHAQPLCIRGRVAFRIGLSPLPRRS